MTLCHHKRSHNETMWKLEYVAHSGAIAQSNLQNEYGIWSLLISVAQAIDWKQTYQRWFLSLESKSIRSPTLTSAKHQNKNIETAFMVFRYTKYFLFYNFLFKWIYANEARLMNVCVSVICIYKFSGPNLI